MKNVTFFLGFQWIKAFAYLFVCSNGVACKLPKYGHCGMIWRYLCFKIDVKSAKNDIFDLLMGVRAPKHEVVFRSEVHFMSKLLSYGKNMVTVG